MNNSMVKGKRIRQGSNLDNDRYVVLILSLEDLESYLNKKEAKTVFESETFRGYFENYLMQDWDESLRSAIEDSSEDGVL